MGEDGLSGGANQFVARDAIGFHLNYYDTSDYTAISGLDRFPGSYAYLDAADTAHYLMVTSAVWRCITAH